MTTKTIEASGFFYVDGIPTKGVWVDLDSSTTWDDIAAAIRDAIPGADCDEILCACAEGVADEFLSAFGIFELQNFREWMEAAERSHLDPEIIAAYCSNNGEWTPDGVEHAEENFIGSFDSAEDFAAEVLDGTGELSEVPERLRYYFDYSAYASDLLTSDCFESDGHYFWNR